MAARRRSSSARRSRGSSPARSSARPSAGAAARASRSREARGGSSTVPCPACGTEHRIPSELLDDPIQCQSCKRTFYPSKASRRGLQKKNPATPFLMGGGILVALIALFWFASSGGGTKQTRNDEPVAKGPELGRKNPRVAAALEWTEALTAGDQLTLSTQIDRTAMREFLGITDIDGTAEDLDKRILTALMTGEKTERLRDFRVASGRVPEQFAEADRGKVRLSLAVKEGKEQDYVRGAAELFVDFQKASSGFRVAGFQWIDEPKLKGAAALADRGVARKSTHEVIGKAEDVERVYNGQKEVVREAELKPLGHLEDTPEAVQKDIDAQIAQLVDIELGGQFANRSILALKKIGKPAVPRLLNKLYELPIDTAENKLRVRRVTMALEDLTGQRFGFDPSTLSRTTDEMRTSALKQWYGWWADNHWREKFDYAIDKGQGEDLLEVDPEEDKKEAAPRRNSPIR